MSINKVQWGCARVSGWLGCLGCGIVVLAQERQQPQAVGEVRVNPALTGIEGKMEAVSPINGRAIFLFFFNQSERAYTGKEESAENRRS